MKTYKYRFLSRPASSFTCPMENFIAFYDDTEYRHHGIVEYSEPLSIEQARHFDLAPLFLDHLQGREVIFFEDLIATIRLKNNPAGQLFFVLTYEDDETAVVWYQFFENVANGRYQLKEPITQ